MARIRHPDEGKPLPKAPPKRKMDRRLIDRDYLSFLHRLECCVTGETDSLTIQHIMAGRESYGKKEDDSVCVPLTRRLHLHDFGSQSVERLGERNFWNKHGIDALGLARDLRNLYDDYGADVPNAIRLIRGHRSMAVLRTRAKVRVFDTLK